MITTVVGSYPSQPSKPRNWREKLLNIIGSYDPYKHAIKIAVKDQIKAGIDIISDGQVRGDMISIFASKIPGMKVENGTSKIISRILPPQNPIGAQDLKFSQRIIKKLGGGQKIKGIITGPTTLVHSSRIEGFYENKEKAIMDMAEALKREASYLEEAGASMIQIDEPFLSTGTVNIKTAKKAVKRISDVISVPVALHACGDIREVFEDLLKFNVEIIDCEFAGNPKNLEIIKDAELKDKKIGFGCIDTKSQKIETIKEIKNLIKKGIKVIGEEKIIIDPDCGMRKLPRNVAFSKLKNMVEAANALQDNSQ
ncbi:MAG TPA: methionine synthase [Methanothermobacter sp.]|nr:methionine synthase [Methanothermobacter tenebrarum]MDD3453894.1 methionine synthase [Methanobacteriales archaeon]MDI6882763.1 methionine synthase [Methanothermobacter sp.]HHW16242.1 methionine synthase [Methanothermobacter sp.]HOQ20645.1 methionine synthase [Methanothermobacter sp.]